MKKRIVTSVSNKDRRTRLRAASRWAAMVFCLIIILFLVHAFSKPDELVDYSVFFLEQTGLRVFFIFNAGLAVIGAFVTFVTFYWLFPSFAFSAGMRTDEFGKFRK